MHLLQHIKGIEVGVEELGGLLILLPPPLQTLAGKISQVVHVHIIIPIFTISHVIILFTSIVLICDPVQPADALSYFYDRLCS